MRILGIDPGIAIVGFGLVRLERSQFELERSGVPIFEYTPAQVKQAVTGYGKAEKSQVMDMVRRLCHLREAPRPDDAADAVALAICHARSSSSLLTRKGSMNSCSTI